MVLLALALVVSDLFAQAKISDYSNMTPSQIEELKASRHAFYAAKSAGKTEAIKQSLLFEKMFMDGNQADYDVRYYGINIKLNFGANNITSRIDYRIVSNVNGLNAIDLNLTSSLGVDSVRINGVPAPFNHFGEMLNITTPSPIARFAEFGMSVYYHGTPFFDGQQGMGFGSVSNHTMCWTNCEPFGSRYWWPCKDYPLDKPDSIDLYIDYPSTYKCMSNGAIISDVANGSGRKLIHFKHNYPVATYLIAITCTDFVASTQTWNYDGHSMPVYSYTINNFAKNAFEAWMIPVLNTLSSRWGTYPFINEKAGNAHYGWGGAMEHQTTSFYNPTFYNDWVIAHETGHQWWGDMITCNTFNHIWLNEGFASYSEALFFEARDGNAAYKNWMQSQRYLGGGTVYVEDLINDDIFSSDLVYDKGSWVVHMLRGVLGDTLFFNHAIKDYYNSQYKYGSATTENLSAIVTNAAGTDMSWFFNEWIYGNGNPAYEISYECSPDPEGGYRLLYLILQAQTGGTYFKMPIKTQFVTTGGTIDTVIWNEGVSQVYDLHFADSVTNVIFDNDQWILRTVVTKPLEMTIVTGSLPKGYNNVPYYVKLEAMAGVPPYYWTLLGGDLPLGVELEGDTVGVLSGTPNFPTTYYFTIQCVDSDTPPVVRQRNYVVEVLDSSPPLSGDANGNGVINVSDVVFLINYIFSSGPAPNPLAVGDADCSGSINISDAVRLVNYIFSGGAAPNCF
jgi:aminopeptidase N